MQGDYMFDDFEDAAKTNSYHSSTVACIWVFKKNAIVNQPTGRVAGDSTLPAFREPHFSSFQNEAGSTAPCMPPPCA